MFGNPRTGNPFDVLVCVAGSRRSCVLLHDSALHLARRRTFREEAEQLERRLWGERTEQVAP